MTGRTTRVGKTLRLTGCPAAVKCPHTKLDTRFFFLGGQFCRSTGHFIILHQESTRLQGLPLYVDICLRAQIEYSSFTPPYSHAHTLTPTGIWF